MEQLARRAPEALEILYDRHSRAVYSLALRIAQQATSAEEIVQDVFLQLWRKAHHYQASRGPLEPWLLTLARNRSLDHMRLKREKQRRREDTLEEQPLACTAPNPEHIADREHRAARVRVLMRSLPERQRRAIELAYLAPEAEPPAALRRKVLAGAGTTKPSERRGWIPVWAWVGAAALVLFALISIFEMRRYQAELASLQDEIRAARSRTLELESERQLYERVLAVRTASGTREIDLKPSGKSALPEVRAFWHAEMGLVLTGHKVPSPTPNHTFQLWVVPKKGLPLSAGIFHPDAAGTVLLVATPSATLADAAALAVSEEPAGGLPQPTKDRILWVGPVS